LGGSGSGAVFAGEPIAGRSCANADGAGQPIIITESKRSPQKRDACMDISRAMGIVAPGSGLDHVVAFDFWCQS